MTMRQARRMGDRLAINRCVVVFAGAIAHGGALAQIPSPAQTPPPAGFSLSLTLGPGWSSNPLDIPGRTKGDASFGVELALRHRWNLWQGAGLTVGVTGFSELFFRDAGAGVNRLVGSAGFSQNWRGYTLSINALARTSADQYLRTHDTAYQEVNASLSRSWTIRPDLTLIPTVGFGRRFYQDGSEDQYRARFGLVLMQKWEKWSFRLGGSYGWTLEDKTPLLPRINDRSYGAFTSATYEWQKDRDVALRLGYSRTLSSYQPNRTKNFTLAPQVSATFRF